MQVQHSQRQHIDLHHVQRVDIILVPFDEGAIVHRGICRSARTYRAGPASAHNRRHAARGAAETRSARMQFDGKLHHRFCGSSPACLTCLSSGRAPAPPHRIRQRRVTSSVSPSALPDVAGSRCAAVVDDGRDDGRAVPARISGRHIASSPSLDASTKCSQDRSVRMIAGG